MQKLQDSVFTLVKTTNLSPAVFSFLQPTDESGDKTPLGGILKDTKHGWLALGPKFCVVDLRTGMKVAARTFGATLSNNATVTSVVELPTPLTENSRQLIISLQCDDISIIVVLNINGSQILRCIQTDVVVTQLAICDDSPDGKFTCYDGIVIAGTKRGEIFAFDLNRAALIQALKDVSQGYEHLIQSELKPTNLSFLPLDSVHRIEEQRELAMENDHHLAVLLNENSFIDGQYIFRNPDGTVRMKAKRDHIRVTVLEYIPQTGSVAVGFNFGAFQIWNLMTLNLEFTSQVNVECLPVTHFGFQEPCDDPRAFCYLWVIFSVIDRYEEEEFPLAVMYSLTYQGKRMLSDTNCLYQDFTSATIRFQVELSTVNETPLLGGKCISCHTYSIKSALGDEGEDNMLNLCQMVWECWAENTNSPMQYGMLLFDLDQWYKDQMPSTYRVESNAFLSASSWSEISGGGSVALHARLDPASVTPYSHATRLEEHFYPNSLQYNCICLNTSEVCVLSTHGIQRQIIASMDCVGPTVLLHPARLHAACAACGLAPLYATHCPITQEEQRRYLLSVALEARLARFLKRCAHDWATGSHSGVGCTLPFLVDWCWKRAIELKENAKEITAPLFLSASLPDRNIVRCLEHCVQQLTQLTGLMDAILTKCCNLVVPDALSEMEEKHKGIGTVSLYFQVVQWFLRVGLLPERVESSEALPYPAVQLYGTYNKRRLKLNRIQDNGIIEENSAHKSCVLLYIDQLLEQEFGGERIHQMWMKGGSECRGLYPPPSLYALLRLYLLPDIAEEHKHSLVLYLLVDYSMIYDDVRYETVIRRLMQFPTMFGLSNTAIKATQAFWHLDHRDFDFALDQLQCLTGNTLSEWQHNVVLSSLLAQKKTQAALQYLHVRKPAPIQNIKDGDYSKINDYDKLEDWQSCCKLYLSRGLVYEALDVIRMCVQNASSLSDKTHVLNMFFKGCRNTGNLAKVLSISFLPFEEEVFIKYMENCNEPQTSEILIMYYLQQARYLEAERYNNKLRHTKPKSKDINTSAESLFESADRDGARDNLVEAMCAALPSIAETVAKCAFSQKDEDWHIDAPRPMSVYFKANSPQNSFTYKSSFIQDTIQNASETWVNRPKIRKGLKRMLNIEETPFICTPKLSRSRSIFNDSQAESTPPKRARLNLTGTPKTPRSAFKVSEKLSGQMEKLLDMPEVQSPVGRIYERSETPHSILKSRRNSRTEEPSPTCSRYLDDTDDELEMETASNHTHYSDTTNKHLRFTIPTPTELCNEPTPSPVLCREMPSFELAKERERSVSTEREKELDISTTESYVTTASHAMNESNPLESPPKKLATDANIAIKKAYKDSVRARRSLSISANSSLSDDPNTSIESIADIPVTLINPRYSGTRRRSRSTESRVETEPTESVDKSSTSYLPLRYLGVRERERSMSTESTRGSIELERMSEIVGKEREMDRLELPKTPKGRRGIRASGESTPLRSGSVTPERQDSPAVTLSRSSRISRSRSKTPELSPRSSPLPPIMEQPKQEIESEPHERSTLSIPRNLRSRSRTPERLDKGVSDSPRLEAIKESPTKLASDSPPASPNRRSLRSRSRTPELEIIQEPVIKPSPRSLRSRSKTPEKMSPKKDHSVRTKKSLSRLVLEANTFAKTKQTLEQLEAETSPESKDKAEVSIECTPMKAQKQVPSLMDVTLSPIVNKSILHRSNDSLLSESTEKEPTPKGNTTANQTMAFPPLQETYFEKSVLRSYQSSVGEFSSIIEEKVTTESREIIMPAFTTIHEDFGRSVLHSCESSVAESSHIQDPTPMKESKPFSMETSIKTDFSSVLHSNQSSLADTQPLNVSSLITDDSDVDMTETECKERKDNKEREENQEREEKQERAEQKEKKQIVEIEREIHEIEDMSNENVSGGESSGEESQSDEEVPDRSDDEDDSMPPNDDEAIHISSDDSSDSSPDASDFEKPQFVSAEMLDKIMSDNYKSKSKRRNHSSESSTSSSSNSVQIDDKSDKNESYSSDSSSKKINSESNDSYQSKRNKSESDVTVESDDSDQSDKSHDVIEPPKQDSKPLGPAKKDVALDKEQISMMTEDNSTVTDKEVTPMFEVTNPLDQAQFSIMTDDNSAVDDAENSKDSVPPMPHVKEQDEIQSKQIEITTSKDEKQIQTKVSETQKQGQSSKNIGSDPLADVSLMTEDNSGSEHEISLNYSDEKIEDPGKEKVEMPVTEMQFNIIVQDINKPEAMTTDVPSPKSVDVVDTSASETEMKEPEVLFDKNVDAKLQSDQITEPKTIREMLKPAQEAIKPKIVQETQVVQKAMITDTVKKLTERLNVDKMDIDSQNKQETIQNVPIKDAPKPKSVQEPSKPETLVTEKMETESQTAEKTKLETVSKPETVKETTEKMDTITEPQSSEQETVKPIRTRKRIKSTSSHSELETKEDEPKTPTTRKRAQSRAKSIEVDIQKETTVTEQTDIGTNTSGIELKTPARKRTQSRAKSTDIDITKASEPTNIDEPKTPATRKRTAKTADELPTVTEEAPSQSEVDIPKDEEPKTPITRKRTQSNQSEETPENITPSRRTKTPNTEVRKIITRRMSREMRELDESNRSLDESVTPNRKNDDNESVVSESSLTSSVQSEGKRRGRKSTLVTKPDLSVIPEVLAEEKEQSTLDVIDEYSGARRLTRHQKSILHKSRGRRPSNASHTSRSSVSEQEDEERQPAFDLQPIDRISLLNKESYDGPPDEDELQLSSMSPESIASDASRMRSRMARAASEARVVVKAAKIHRRIASLDVADDSPLGSPALSGNDSPARSRRASFNRAIEALHTPKGRRQSTDSRKNDNGSPFDSPATSDVDMPTTPSRRGRRASTQSNTSQTGRTRSKKAPALEDIEEAKK